MIDKSKLLRAEKRKFSDIEQDVIPFGGGLYYDSRKDLALKRFVKRDISGKLKYYRRIVREEHYTFISEPDAIFLGYIPLKKNMETKTKIKAAEHCANEIFSFIKKRKLETDLKVIGCDGTNFNVGGACGVNHFIEVKLKHPIYWFICLLHTNELPFKQLIIELDGPTNGSRRLGTTKIGELNHSRWLTTTSRCCRLYVSIKNPSELMQLITKPLVVPKLKCHTQMVERAVKEVTRVSVKAIDHGTRNSMIKATLLNRAKYPRLDSRKDFYQN